MSALALAEGLERPTYLAAKPDEAWLRETVIEALLRFDGSAWLADLKDCADYRLDGLDIIEATLEDARKVVGMVSEEAIRRVVRALREEGVVTTVLEADERYWGDRRRRLRVRLV